MHGAGAAQRYAAAELRAGHPQHVAQYPEQRRVTVDIDGVWIPVDFDIESYRILSSIPTKQIPLKPG
jgi:hypothetical protein